MKRRELFAAGRHADCAAASRAAEGDAGDRLPRRHLARSDAPFVAAFRQGLSETGYVEGQNVAIEYRWAEGHYDRLPALAADLVGRKVDVIAATRRYPSGTGGEKRDLDDPDRLLHVSDPVATGLVTSLARPGGNLTGVSILNVELMPKRLELLSELVPQARVIALLVNPNNPICRAASSETRRKRRARRGCSSIS